MKVFGLELVGVWKTLFWIITSIGILSLIISVAMLVIWIYYSWIRRENTKNWTGKDLTRHMLDEANLKDVEVKESWFYFKYWNFNKKRRRHKLRPWTYNRRSIWTMMEAAQQAYATTIRSTKGKTYWMLFRVPGLLKFFGTIAGFGLAVWGIYEAKSSSISHYTFSQWLRIGIGVSVLTISFLVAETGKVWILYKNVPAIIEKAGFSQEEVKAIKRIYFWRFILAIIQVIIEVIKIAMQIASENSNGRRSN